MRQSISRALLWSFAVSVVLLSLGGCSSGTAAEDSDAGLLIVATTTIWGDVARNVAGDFGTVEVLMPNGADPHDFQPSSQQVARIYQADLVIANGLGLEVGLLDVLDAAAADGVNILEIAQRLDPIPFGEATSGDGGGSYDPHVWMDPYRVAIGAGLIAGRLQALDPEGGWTDRSDMYGDELSTTDATIVATLSTVPADDRKMVTSHDAFGYFATRYDFEVIGTLIPGGSTLADLSSSGLADLVATMRTQNVKVIFTETTQPEGLADAVSAEIGTDVQVVGLYSGSLGAPGSGADTLIGMLITNAESIADAI